MFEGLVEVSHWQSMIGDASNLSLILDVNNIGGDDTFLMFAQPSLTNDVGFPQLDENHPWNINPVWDKKM